MRLWVCIFMGSASAGRANDQHGESTRIFFERRAPTRKICAQAPGPSAGRAPDPRPGPGAGPRKCCRAARGRRAIFAIASPGPAGGAGTTFAVVTIMRPQHEEHRIEDIMTQEILAVGSTTSLAAVIQLFLNHRIAGAPVVDEVGHPIGIVTSTDLLDPRRRSQATGEPRYFRLWRGEVRAIGITDEGGLEGTGVVADVMSPEILAVD